MCDPAVLGKRLGKTFAAVQTAVKAMSQKDLNSFSQSGKAVVNGETLTLGEDVKIVYEVASAMADVEATSFLGAVALFHTKLRFFFPSLLCSCLALRPLIIRFSQEMIDSGTARELVNRVQRLRKKAGLVPSDRIEVFMDAPADIQQIARAHADLISHTIGCPIIPASAPPPYMCAVFPSPLLRSHSSDACISMRRLMFASTDDEVAGKAIKLFLGRKQLHCIAVPEGVKASKTALQNVLNLLGTDRHFAALGEVCVMQFTVDGEKVSLTRDVHVTFGLRA